MFAKRQIKPELLDHASPEEAYLNLCDLIRINTMFGGHATIRRSLARVIRPEERFTLLDVGAASGDTARVIAKAYGGATVTSLDYSPVNLRAAPRPKLVGDAFALPFAANSFDYVLSSLFLHHFTDEQVVLLLKSFYRIARRALIICDLERNPLPYYFLPATRALFKWQRITLHDGPISVRAAFWASELRSLASQAGIGNVILTVYRPAFRISMVALKLGLHNQNEGPVGTRRKLPTGGDLHYLQGVANSLDATSIE